MTANDTKKLILYVEIPFCPLRCPSCRKDTLEAGTTALRDDYLSALRREVEATAPDFEDCIVEAVWVGGGIAGHMFDEGLVALLRSLSQRFRMSPQAELSLKAHPGMVSVETLNACRKGKVGRLVFEFETANPAEYERLGRFLDPSAMEMTELVLGRSSLPRGFNLIVGLQGQTIATVRHSIDSVSAYRASHISLYPFTAPNHENAHLQAAAEQQAELLGFASSYLGSLGFVQYLPYHFALPGYECRFFELEAEGTDVLGFGLGAETRFCGSRATNTSDLATYIAYSDIPQRCIAGIDRYA